MPHDDSRRTASGAWLASERRSAAPATGDAWQQLVWFCRLRLVVITAWLLPTLLFDFVLKIDNMAALRTQPLYFVIGLSYLLGFAALFAAPRLADSVPVLAALQFGGDIVVETVLLHVLGYEGAVALAIALFFLTTFLACTYLSRSHGALFATGAFGLQVAAQLLAHFGLLPMQALRAEIPASAVDVKSVVFHLFTFMFTFYGTAWLVGSRAERLQEVTENLADLRAFNERVVESMAAGLVTTDQAGRIQFANAAACRLFGEPALNLRGARLHERLGWEDHEAEDLASLQAPGASRRLARDADLAGRRAALEVRASQVSDRGGRRVGLLFLIEDVTELRELEAEIQTKEKMAAIGEMAAGIAHEIRNPLASISGSVQMLRDSLALGGNEGRLMNIVLKESSRLDATIREFLQFARPRAARPRLVDLAELARETVALLANSEEVRPDHVLRAPAPGLRAVVLVDPDQVRQVLWNLCKNALKAMPEGGTLEVSAGPQGADAVLAVTDSGVGMTPAMRSRAFQPLAGEFKGGMGLGLAIVYRIVEDHGGRILIDSSPGRGTRVEIRLPRSEGRPAADATASEVS